MADLWRDFASGPDPPEEVYVVIEMTRGSRNKYEYDARNGVFRLNRVLYTYFPCDYGFIPQTLDDDARAHGDAMDDKIVTVSTTDPFFMHVRSLDDIPPSLVRELTYFFENYKRAEDKTTKVERWDDSDEAKKIIEWSMDYYKKNA